MCLSFPFPTSLGSSSGVTWWSRATLPGWLSMSDQPGMHQRELPQPLCGAEPLWCQARLQGGEPACHLCHWWVSAVLRLLLHVWHYPFVPCRYTNLVFFYNSALFPFAYIWTYKVSSKYLVWTKIMSSLFLISHPQMLGYVAPPTIVIVLIDPLRWQPGKQIEWQMYQCHASPCIESMPSPPHLWLPLPLSCHSGVSKQQWLSQRPRLLQQRMPLPLHVKESMWILREMRSSWSHSFLHLRYVPLLIPPSLA